MGLLCVPPLSFPLLDSHFLYIQGPPGPTGRQGEKVGPRLGVVLSVLGVWQVGHWDLGLQGDSLTCPCFYPLSTGGAWSSWGPCSGGE